MVFAMGGVAQMSIDEAAIMAVLEEIPDPEIPVLTITDLGIVRGIAHGPLRVLISPTYTGCPATVAIEASIREALDKAGFAEVHIERQLFPPWTTDWITPRGRERLHAYGIAPPSSAATAQCPLCGSSDTSEVSRFGSTPCKAQWRCNTCLEPFERFKCH
jgi:ring-1,2-phenylacetyl-CoA epoxidase subunit PaaD